MFKIHLIILQPGKDGFVSTEPFSEREVIDLLFISVLQWRFAFSVLKEIIDWLLTSDLFVLLVCCPPLMIKILSYAQF